MYNKKVYLCVYDHRRNIIINIIILFAQFNKNQLEKIDASDATRRREQYEMFAVFRIVGEKSKREMFRVPEKRRPLFCRWFSRVQKRLVMRTCDAHVSWPH